MSNRARVIAIAAALSVGLFALALIPGRTMPKIAEADAAGAALPTIVRHALASPNPDLLRQLDAELAPSEEVVAPPPAKVAAITPAPIPSTTDLATTAASMPDPNLRPDTIGFSAVNLRAGPSSSSPQLSVLQPGESIQVGEAAGGWVKVTRADGSSGWVYSSYLASNANAATAAPSRTAATQPRAVIHGDTGDLEDRTARIASRLPAYSRPNDGASSVFTLQPGDEVYISEVRGNWLRVETQDGMSAWIRR